MEIKNIAAALLEVQRKIKNPSNTAVNPFFRSKYAPLPDILNCVRPILTENGILLIQNTGSNEAGDVYVQTKLIHTSGEVIETDKLLLKPEKNTAQGIGSAITYGRRYQLTALLGISSEDDDDGNIASKARPKDGSNHSQDDAEAVKWIAEITEMLVAKNFNVNENAIISKAKQLYNGQQIKRIEDQLKRK
ncbi:ERF family protein [Methanobacterium sp. MBAC-LM]|uniref:ERF family protein n=1 Tax=Methanobacterium sp. MBAC-LM TaxID=3412034 RepID=UPI003C715BA2